MPLYVMWRPLTETCQSFLWVMGPHKEKSWVMDCDCSSLTSACSSVATSDLLAVKRSSSHYHYTTYCTTPVCGDITAALFISVETDCGITKYVSGSKIIVALIIFKMTDRTIYFQYNLSKKCFYAIYYLIMFVLHNHHIFSCCNRFFFCFFF